MSTQDQIEWLLAQAEKLQVVAAAEERAVAAKEAYRANPDDPAAKAEHRDASTNLANARAQARSTNIIDVQEGDAVATPAPSGG